MYMTIYVVSVFSLVLFWIPYCSAVLSDTSAHRGSFLAVTLPTGFTVPHCDSPSAARVLGCRQWEAFACAWAGPGALPRSYLPSQKRVHQAVHMEPGPPHLAQTSGSSLSRRLSYATCDLRVSMPRPLAVFLATFSEVGPFFPPARFMSRANPASSVSPPTPPPVLG